ncbi:transporter substrate-binding domain-containing protein [Noviherbaspirillum sp.]|uniref:substrate-binding periplasmic protein n=1 Tax=Noviherbaspirillum sp. TaxID=1926288 RepID=UPI002D2B4FF8|nr:transporter substrate-binding domain-containing protein [Noviherbaspirillum sp.]HZW22552.1 transporter substrate-binding domain-containing protein [Noviherbaspirillum sp.]
MVRRFAFRVLLPLCASAAAHASPGTHSAGPDVMRLASLDWLPYVGAGLEQEGWSSFVADAAARHSGRRAKIDYFPWTRAVQLGTRDPNYAGYFPAYYTEERARTCHFSAPIGSSTVGFAYLQRAPLQWASVQDLTALRIGVVAGFSNGPAFDAMAREGKLRLDASPNDMLNLRKLLAGRVDTVVIDKLVLRYLLATEPGLARERKQFAFHDKPLAELSLHVCFQRTPAGREMQQAFDQGMQGLSLRKLEAEYFQRIEKQ